jgi:hypothetical protein
MSAQLPRRLKGEGCRGKLVISEQPDQFVEQPVQVLSVGQFIVFVNDPSSVRRTVERSASPLLQMVTSTNQTADSNSTLVTGFPWFG